MYILILALYNISFPVVVLPVLAVHYYQGGFIRWSRYSTVSTSGPDSTQQANPIDGMDMFYSYA